MWWGAAFAPPYMLQGFCNLLIIIIIIIYAAGSHERKKDLIDAGDVLLQYAAALF